MSNRRLYTSISRFLTKKSPLNPTSSLNSHPRLESSRVLSRSFTLSLETTSLWTCYNLLSSNSRVSTKNFCSKSEDKDFGRCWNCGAVATSAPFLACTSCRSVQPLDPSIDYFKIFGLEKGFEIKDENLETKYKDWQKKLHPDLVHSKSEKERTYAAEQSARVIDAYHTLDKPLLRALYLLQLEGIHVDEEKTVSDPELLAEIMEIREAVEEANDSQALKQIQSQIQRKLERWSNSFGNAFKNQEFENAIKSILRMTYYQRAIEAIVKKL
ncbi:DNAJ heat shock N-terminal domain-containing protein [Tasmannia lanceolata]|uniref:DNAJ heat shock N-terminal domain-containing protein n=1 Tax=Tasmannia lanceolata TaxID=3420 RepID=UPI004062C0AC